MYDVAVIGGGVVGGMILRELSRYAGRFCLLEAQADIAMGASRANSGIAHAGFDAKEGSLKAKFNLEGSLLMEDVCRELGVKYERNGSLVVAFSEEEIGTLHELYERGVKNGVSDMEILDREALRREEPNIGDEALAALHAKSGGIVCPYELTVASIGNAIDNGAELYYRFRVQKIEKCKDYYILHDANGRTVEARYIVNAAGLACAQVAALLGDYSFRMKARRGEYIVLDKEHDGLVRHTLFFCPSKLGKGILVSPTVDRNILLGPTAVEQDGDETLTTAAGLATVLESADRLCKNLPRGAAITSFAGVRAYCDRHDFIIEWSRADDHLYNVAGIESPGLTSAPAIGRHVAAELSGVLALEKKEGFVPTRRPAHFFSALSQEEKCAYIKDHPDYGRIVCRCEGISLGELRDAVRTAPRAETVDAVKRRTRAGMGRCQGGFCQPVVVRVISEELGIPYEEVTKSGGDSLINVERIK